MVAWSGSAVFALLEGVSPVTVALWSAALYIGLFVSVLAHELTHAVVARLSGMAVTEFRVGGGRSLELHLGECRIAIGAFPTSGRVLTSPNGCSLGALCTFKLAGPAVSVLLALMASACLFLRRSPDPWPYLWLLLATLNFCFAFIGDSQSAGTISGFLRQDVKPSSDLADFFLIRRLSRALPRELARQLLTEPRLELSSLDTIRASLLSPPASPVRDILMVGLIRTLRRPDASEFGAGLLEVADVLPSNTANPLNNMVAHNAAVYGWPEWDKRMLAVTDRLIRDEPDNPAFIDTRGAVLTRLGRGTEALPLLTVGWDVLSAMPDTPEWRRETGLWHAFRAKALLDSGAPLDQVEQQIRLAKELGIDAPILQLVESAVLSRTAL